MIKIIKNGSITTPKGFKAGAVYAGLKSPGEDKYDLGIIYSSSPSNWAGVFTKNIIVSPLNCINDSTNTIQLNLSPGLNESGVYDVFFQTHSFADFSYSFISLFY